MDQTKKDVKMVCMKSCVIDIFLPRIKGPHQTKGKE